MALFNKHFTIMLHDLKAVVTVAHYCKLQMMLPCITFLMPMYKVLENVPKSRNLLAGNRQPSRSQVMPFCRSDIAFGDWHAVKQQIDKAKKLCDEGGDWERKNRLKVYEALFLMVTRDFKKAGELFLDSTATFGA